MADAEIAVAESEVVASGSIGPEGGEIKDEWGDVCLRCQLMRLKNQHSLRYCGEWMERGLLYLYNSLR